jgi:hypothetical protein
MAFYWQKDGGQKDEDALRDVFLNFHLSAIHRSAIHRSAIHFSANLSAQ